MSSTIDFGELQKGDRAKVVSVPGPEADVKRLQEMGLILGTTFDVIKVAPLGDPIEISLRGYRLCLRRQDTAGFLVERV